jgi:hypothetical protein
VPARPAAHMRRISCGLTSRARCVRSVGTLIYPVSFSAFSKIAMYVLASIFSPSCVRLSDVARAVTRTVSRARSMRCSGSREWVTHSLTSASMVLTSPAFGLSPPPAATPQPVLELTKSSIAAAERPPL